MYESMIHHIYNNLSTAVYRPSPRDHDSCESALTIVTTVYRPHAGLIGLYYQTYIMGLHQTRVPGYPGLKAAKPVNPGLKNTLRVCIP